MTVLEFSPWPKTPRLRRDAVITEKIDGTNAAVILKRVAWSPADGDPVLPDNATAVQWDTDAPDHAWIVAAQSRNRLITPGKTTDNFGFSAWVQDNSLGLIETLGEGVHFGEWWGHGIGRGYGLESGDRRFSLFNVHRYAKAIPPTDRDPYDPRPVVPGLGVVPVLDRHTFDTSHVDEALDALAHGGSLAAPGFYPAEGVVVFHSQSGQVYKALLENDAISKTEAGVA